MRYGDLGGFTRSVEKSCQLIGIIVANRTFRSPLFNAMARLFNEETMSSYDNPYELTKAIE